MLLLIDEVAVAQRVICLVFSVNFEHTGRCHCAVSTLLCLCFVSMWQQSSFGLQYGERLLFLLFILVAFVFRTPLRNQKGKLLKSY